MNARSATAPRGARLLAALALVGLAAILGAITPGAARADTPPDILDSYAIAVSPASDGMLTVEYTLTGYHVASDWPSDQPYLQIGVPNSKFTISSHDASGAAVSKVESVNGNGSFVQFDFSTLHRNGDTFNLHFVISQGQMAFKTTDGKGITFKFIPSAWTFPIKVKHLAVSWANPTSAAALVTVEPTPVKGDTAMSWGWDNPVIGSGGMFSDYSVKLAYDASAFTLSEAATTTSDSGNGGAPLDAGAIVLIVVVVIVIALALLVVAGLALDEGGYGDDDGGGGGIFVGGGHGLGGGGGGGHSGGGGLGGGGGGFSCACAGCACACACAGGGRVGCSRKAIGVGCLPDAIAAAEGRMR